MLLTQNLLKEARLAAGLTQAELAARLGTSQSEIARLESRRANPRVSTLQRAIEATGHTVQATLQRVSPDVDETMSAANLRLDPGERLRRFAAAYRSVSKLTRKARIDRGP